MTGSQWQPGVRGVAWVHMDPPRQHSVSQLSCYTHNMYAHVLYVHSSGQRSTAYRDTCGHTQACEMTHTSKPRLFAEICAGKNSQYIISFWY